MTAEARRELAVDHVIAVDGLGQEPRQRALGSLAVDGVEGEREAEQRRHDPDERVDAQDRMSCGPNREQREEDRRRAVAGWAAARIWSAAK